MSNMEGPKIKRKAQVVLIAPNSQGQISVLLLQTNEKRGNFWQNITGSVEKKEDFLAGATRELKEETGAKLEQGEMVELDLCFEFYDRKNRLVEERCFLFMSPCSLNIRIDPKEHQRYRWISLNDIKEDDYKYPSNYHTFLVAKKYVESKGRP